MKGKISRNVYKRQNQNKKNVPEGVATPDGHIENKALKVYLMIEEKKRRNYDHRRKQVFRIRRD